MATYSPPHPSPNLSRAAVHVPVSGETGAEDGCPTRDGETVPLSFGQEKKAELRSEEKASVYALGAVWQQICDTQ